MSVDPNRCPLCGRSNACAVAEGAAKCWCFDLKIPDEAMARIPESARGEACLCADCARGVIPSPCIRVCVMDDKGETCLGCKRSMEEVRDWPAYDSAQKLAVLRRLQEG